MIQEIIKKKPRTIGISIHANNRAIVKKFVSVLRNRMPDVKIIVGGYDCVYSDIGPHLFSDYDHMVIGEAELTIEPLLKALARGEQPKNMPGVISRYDSPNRVWVETPLIDDLDSIDFPQYQWIDLSLYQSFTGNHLVPIAASRGCRWGKCRFCAECFPFRIRSPYLVADEIEFFVNKGFFSFHFNESDVNGDPQALYEICSEIIRRGLKFSLIGQIRIHKKNTREYFYHLAKAGFRHLRFGVDGWSENTLRLQRKGYNMKLVVQNLRNCHKAGMYTTVNMVIGVPGETDNDVDQMIENMIRCKDYIDSVEGINTLILAAGSEYYKNPDIYKIRFRGEKNTIYKQNPYYIPTDLWYSVAPYIDQTVRIQRMNRIYSVLSSNKLNVGDFARQEIKRLRKTLD
ncbi:MAG: B12-binding domain-containing radical SAM protein [Desulfobacterales bacterium]|nr:MAG: B12-binding domain-containing radical SAM protein [Desulfobacterales bacterium]